MVPVNLNKPGRLALQDSGYLYRVYQSRFGSMEIERIRDGATLLLQGDDAAQIEADLVKGDVCDIICDAYDNLLEPPAPVGAPLTARPRTTP